MPFPRYITYVVRKCSSLYEQLSFSLEDDVDINCVENGILLRKEIHVCLSKAKSVFLTVRPELSTYVFSTVVSNVRRVQAPNFAMVPADVPRIEQGAIPLKRTTLQHVEPPTGLICSVT